MEELIIPLSAINLSHLALVGGKAANLGEMMNIEGILVPDGFCVTVNAFDLLNVQQAKASTAGNAVLKTKSGTKEEIVISKLKNEIQVHLSRFPPDQLFAIRSSATAEDLPTASFAGQHDSFLNISGIDSIIEHIVHCQASLLTDRAVEYSNKIRFDFNKIKIAVIVQAMAPAESAGILFTADPINGNRNVSSIEATSGLGESLVAGLVVPDSYRVSSSEIIAQRLQVADEPILNVKQIWQLDSIGRKIESHFGMPQDIEWCLYDNEFYIVQSRPITTLYPVPKAEDNENHVYLSVGHQQMMTDAMKPLGLSFFLMSTMAPMRIAGGRLFVDATRMLSTSAGRTRIIDTLGKSDALYKSALEKALKKEHFILTSADKSATETEGVDWRFKPQIENDSSIVEQLMLTNETSRKRLQDEIRSKSGSALLKFIRNDFNELKTLLADPVGTKVFMTAMEATAWINERVEEWLGEKNVGDVLSHSIANNVTSNMGLALMDLSDRVRFHPELISYLQHIKDNDFLADIDTIDGGRNFKHAFLDFLDKYGMRCSGEIDISNKRWSEDPKSLLNLVLNNLSVFEAGASQMKFQRGLTQAMVKKNEILQRLQRLPDGETKALEAELAINYIRNYIGYREYPKYAKIAREFIYKNALLEEAENLLKKKVISNSDDIFYLYFDELEEVVETQHLDQALIAKRKEEFEYFRKLSPPRIICSDGEVFSGNYIQTNVPENTLMGLPVTSGIVEGRARVIMTLQEATLEAGDILVTKFTDPGWTILFVSIKGLITEIGGLMTHGAVIAREYGLPAVVGVENATTLIKDGQRIRLNGTDGYVEIL